MLKFVKNEKKLKKNLRNVILKLNNKNSYRDLTAFFIPPRYIDHKNIKEENIPKWLSELPPR